MTRALSADNEAGIVAKVTRPVYLVQFDFATPLYLSSRETISYANKSFAAASMKVTIGGSDQVRLYNGNLAYTATFAAGADGVRARVWQVYGEPPFNRGDANCVFDGEIGAVGLGEWITVQLREARPTMVPRLSVAPSTFRHLPPEGAEFLTPSGLFKLERQQ